MSLTKISKILVFLGGVSISIGAAKDQLIPVFLAIFPNVNSYFFDPKFILNGLLILGIILILLSIIVYFFSKIPKKTKSYTGRAISAEDIDRIHPIINELIPGEIASIASMKSWLSHRDNIIYIVENLVSSKWYEKRTIVGIYSIFELNNRGMEKMENNLSYGTSITIDDIATESHEIKALYIGALAGIGIFAKAAVLQQVMGHILSRAKKPIPLYIRPVTPDGKRLAIKYGFKPCNPNEPKLHHKKIIGT